MLDAPIDCQMPNVIYKLKCKKCPAFWMNTYRQPELCFFCFKCTLRLPDPPTPPSPWPPLPGRPPKSGTFRSARLSATVNGRHPRTAPSGSLPTQALSGPTTPGRFFHILDSKLSLTYVKCQTQKSCNGSGWRDKVSSGHTNMRTI